MVLRLVGLLIALALVGCASPVPGSPMPNADEVRLATQPLTARDALGDFATINYCSLFDQNALPTAKWQLLRLPKPSFEHCTFSVKADRAEVEVQVGFLGDEESLRQVDRTMDRQRNPPRGLTVQRGAEDDHVCERYLVFADEVSISIDASSYVDDKEGDWCPLVDATLDIVMDRLLAKKVRHFDFADNSLGALDACDLVPGSEVGRLVGAPVARVVHHPSRHSCEWPGITEADPWTVLYFDLWNASLELDSTEETIAGYPTTVTSRTDERYSGCSVETYTIDSTELGTKEAIIIQVVLSGKDKDACAPARALAKEVWPKLPK